MTKVDDDSSGPAFDLPRIVETFNRDGVTYLAIGGVSGLLHGAVHYVTQDVDMMAKSAAANLGLIISALTELGATIPPDLQTDDLTVNTQWVTPSGRIDILLTALGPKETVIMFSELDRHADLIEVAAGLLMPTASLDDVIRMKEAKDRVKDHQALPELRKLRGDANPERSRGSDPFLDLPIDGDEYEPD